MQYRSDRKGTKLSVLGYGCLRFTKENGKIDIDKTEKEIMEAIRSGVNYFDTAYVYGGSEAALGEILARNGVREQVYIATKLPHYLIKSKAGLEKCFQEQLKRLRTDHVDYYLMHMLNDVQTWQGLCAKGVDQWIREKQASGQIGSIGFSYHGNSANFKELLDAYDWDFCQIQYNYMDEHTQAGRTGLQEAAKRGIPVIIMEPLRGGKLVDLLPEKAKKRIAEDPKKRTPAELAFRWLWEQPEVTCVLSGMNSEEMIRENVRIASEVQTGEFTEEDFSLIEAVKKDIQDTLKVGCTGCGYCMPCPKGIDIPAAFRCYNHMYTEKKGAGRHEYLQTVCLQKDFRPVSACVECGKCESHCPQHLAIRQKLKEADGKLLPFYYKIGLKVVKKLGLFW